MPMPRITMVASPGTWVVRADGAVIGESERAIELVEGDAAAVVYFPREDLGMAFLDRSERVSSSPDLGEARFFSVVTPGATLTDAAWSYESPAPGADRIAGLIAFDARRIAIEEI